MSLNDHHTMTRVGVNDEWLTPPYIIEALGPFDLDPCSPISRPYDTAAHHYTIEDDGLSQPWEGRIWLNPPYGMEAARWLERLAGHGDGIALIFARTETRTFLNQIWERADALLFLAGRISFHRADGSGGLNSGAPSVLVAYGMWAVAALNSCGLAGAVVNNWRVLRSDQMGLGL